MLLVPLVCVWLYIWMIYTSNFFSSHNCWVFFCLFSVLSLLYSDISINLFLFYCHFISVGYFIFVFTCDHYPISYYRWLSSLWILILFLLLPFLQSSIYTIMWISIYLVYFTYFWLWPVIWITYRVTLLTTK